MNKIVESIDQAERMLGKTQQAVHLIGKYAQTAQHIGKQADAMSHPVRYIGKQLGLWFAILLLKNTKRMVLAVAKYTNWCDGADASCESIHESVFRFVGMVVKLLSSIAHLFPA